LILVIDLDDLQMLGELSKRGRWHSSVELLDRLETIRAAGEP
jgi:hypothetical protein